ncbi:protein MNN4-like, partial [Ctenocephalides felis]|uniref:protein MNN4-like n=1 Tax=Ctenocephalides felis TaxID=7515 RepID=UPI000E6E5539
MSTFVITYALILLLLPYGNTHPDPRKTSKSKLRQTSVEVPENIVIPGVIVGGDTKYGSMKEKPHFGKAVSPSDVMDQIINILETKSGTTESVVTISPTTKVYTPVAVKNKDPKVVLEHLEDIITALKHLSKEAKKNEERQEREEEDKIRKSRGQEKKEENKKDEEKDKKEKEEYKKEKEEDKIDNQKDKKYREDDKKDKEEDKKEKEEDKIENQENKKDKKEHKKNEKRKRGMKKIIRRLMYRHRNM